MLSLLYTSTLAVINLPRWGLAIAVAVFVMVSLLMIGVILLQRPQGGGLTAAFGGGAGAGQTAFGTKTGDALTIFTCLVFAAYVGVAIFLNHAARPATAAAETPVVESATPETAPATTGQTGPTGPTGQTGSAPTGPGNGETVLPGPTTVPGANAPVPAGTPAGLPPANPVNPAPITPAPVTPPATTPGGTPGTPSTSPAPTTVPPTPQPNPQPAPQTPPR